MNVLKIRILTILMMLTVGLLSAQTMQGYWNAAMNGKRVGTDRTTWGKAYTDGLILKSKNPDSTITVLPPRQWTVTVPKELLTNVIIPVEPEDDPIYISSIRVFNITSTSIQLDFEVSQSDYEEVVFAIKEEGDSLDWVTHRLSEMYVESSQYYTNTALKPNTTYLYTLHVTKGNTEFNSHTYKFKTL